MIRPEIFIEDTGANVKSKPGLLRPSEVYAVAGYILNLNGIIGDADVMDSKSLPKVKMPNRDGFVADPRPDVGEKAKKPN